MLPPFIIEQIRKRETEERAHREQPRLEIPVERTRTPTPREDEVTRGVVILDLLGD